MKRVPFGVNCSPFLLNATICHHLQQEKQNFASEEVRKIVDKMQDSFYACDCLSRLSVREQVDEFQTASSEIMLNANMELRKWRRSNIKSSEDAGTKVLGLTWDSELDCLSLSAEFAYYKQWTRRTLLKLLASIFDSLGFITPFTIAGKKVVCTIVEGEQRLGHILQWNLGRSDIEMGRPTVTNFLFSHHALDWCSRSRKILSPFFHGHLGSSFCMLRLPVSCQQVLLTVFKGKFAPKRKMTIARLELQAAYLSARCVEFVCNKLRINTMKIFAWTDSLV